MRITGLLFSKEKGRAGLHNPDVKKLVVGVTCRCCCDGNGCHGNRGVHCQFFPSQNYKPSSSFSIPHIIVSPCHLYSSWLSCDWIMCGSNTVTQRIVIKITSCLSREREHHVAHGKRKEQNVMHCHIKMALERRGERIYKNNITHCESFPYSKS